MVQYSITAYLLCDVSEVGRLARSLVKVSLELREN